MSSRRKTFLQYLADHHDAHLAITRALSAKLRLATRHRVDFSGPTVDVRLARVLSELVGKNGRPAAEGTELGCALDAYQATISDSREDLGEVAKMGVELKDKTFPDICHTTQEAVDGVYDFYATVRLLIGGLKADPPSRTTKTTGQDAAGNITGYIGTSIPATSTVNLEPLFDREHRLDALEAQRVTLLHRIDSPPAPVG